MKDSYFTDPKINGYKVGAYKKLISDIRKMSFEYKEPDGMGGGSGEIVQQIIAHFNIYDVSLAILSGLVVNRIEKMLSKLSNWHRENKKTSNKLRPLINIYIYEPFDKWKSYSLSFRLDKVYTKKEILKQIEKAMPKIKKLHKK